MKVFGLRLSPFVRKVLIVANLKGIDVDFRMVRPHGDDPDFRATSPFGLIPAIDDDGFCLSDSSAIILYLDRRTPTPPLLPSDAQAYGRALWLEEFGDSILGKACGGYAAQVAFMPKIYNKPSDDVVIKKLLEKDIPAVLDYLESVIPGSGFLTGPDFGLADASVVSALMALMLARYTIDEERWPKTTAYIKQALAHPAVSGEVERMVQAAKEFGIL